jgi:hypothetical protein
MESDTKEDIEPADALHRRVVMPRLEIVKGR